MPLGMTGQVIEPTAASSPEWVQHLVNAGRDDLEQPPDHGAGLGGVDPGRPRHLVARRATRLLVTPRRSRDWVAGESSSGSSARASAASSPLHSRGPSGPPVQLSSTAWPDCSSLFPRECGRAGDSAGRSFSVMGLFFIGMAVLQAWPGRGFWQGRLGHNAAPGTLAGMVKQMSATPQPAFISSWLAGFASFDAAHGWAVNLFLVISLAAIGIAFLAGRASVARVAVYAGIVLCVADWVLVEDFGFFGGVGTDPNSMIPISLRLCWRVCGDDTGPCRRRRAGLGHPGGRRRLVVLGTARKSTGVCLALDRGSRRDRHHAYRRRSRWPGRP